MKLSSQDVAVERCTPRRAHANSNLRAEMQGRREQRGFGEYVQRAKGMVKAMLSRSIDVDACQCEHCKHPGLRKSFIRPLLSKLRYSVLALKTSNLARVLEDCSSLLLMMERREEIGRHTHTHIPSRSWLSLVIFHHELDALSHWSASQDVFRMSSELGSSEIGNITLGYSECSLAQMSFLTSLQVRPGDQPGYPPISRVASLAVDS